LVDKIGTFKIYNKLKTMSTHIQRSALLPYSASDMFNLVNNVAQYPDFLPWCDYCNIFEQDDSHMIAEVGIAKAGIKQKFVTHNILTLNQKIEMNLVSGPFKYLHGIWQFNSLDIRASKISLDLIFSYSGKLISLSLGPIFNKAADKMLSAFCERANQVL